MGTSSVSAALSALSVSSPSEGGQSMNTKSYAPRTAARAFLSTCSRAMRVTSSTSAPASSMFAGTSRSVSSMVGRTASESGRSLMNTS